MYVANAGDSRAVICNGEQYQAMSVDFTPENERDRIRRLAEEQPALLGKLLNFSILRNCNNSVLGKEFTFREYIRQPKSVDLGKPIMYRDARMKGWAYKTLQHEDLKMPVITGHGKRVCNKICKVCLILKFLNILQSRVMGTIGVTRGFGDHDLLAVYQKTPIKPFLSPHPEVQVHRLDKTERNEVLVMGTDGLWDVIHGSKAAEIVCKALSIFSEKERYVSAATCLVGSARGSLVHEHSWQLKTGKQASVDDISVFVIPLFYYKEEHEDWKGRYLANPMDCDEN